ncbi:MAG: DNA polymerase III subunit beta [Planctomycetota bacterium]
MKVICDRSALLDAVKLVSRVVAVRTPKPQLTCVKLTAEPDGSAAGAGTLTLAATDAEVSLRLATDRVEVTTPGEALIPADKLEQIVVAQENEPTLTLEADGEACHIRGGDAKFKVFGYPPADFPPLPEFPEEGAGTSFGVDAGVLGEAIDRTVFSTARETSRYAINGVLLVRTGKKIEMVATDGRRLALARLGSDGEASSDRLACIIPTKALNVLGRLISSAGTEAAVRVAVTDNRAMFHIDDGNGAPTVLGSNLVEGTFPPYEDVIPKDQDKKATFDVETLRSAVRRAALLTNEESRGVRLAFTTNGGQHLTLSSRAPEMGEAEVKVEMNAYEGEDIEIGFNPAFITDALKVVEGHEVVLEMKAPNKPGLMKSGSDFLYVVMPVNLQ